MITLNSMSLLDITEKQCALCKLVKPVCEFNKAGLTRYSSWCRDCAKQQKKIWDSKQPRKNKQPNIYTPEFLQQVQILFDQGLGKQKIAKKLNTRKHIITTAYKKLGLYKSDQTKSKQNPRRAHLYTERKCVKCQEIKSIEHFHKYIDKKGKTNYKSRCSICQSEYDKKHGNAYYRTHKEEARIYARTRERKKRKNTYYRIRQSISRAINRSLKKRGSSKNNQSCLKYLPSSIEQIIAHLENNFEPWMTRDNYGVYYADQWDDNDPTTWKWNIDHIIPQSDLPHETMEEENFRKCWALENLRPYSAKQNVLDGSSRVRHKKKNKA